MSYDGQFVKEVVRLIRGTFPERLGKRTVVLVSSRFFEEASQYVLDRNSNICGELQEPTGQLFFKGLSVCAVHWLSDYEFEIRPQVKVN